MDFEKADKLRKRQAELASRFERLDNAQEDRDIAEVLSTAAGRRMLTSIIGRGRVFGSVYNQTQNDPIKLAYETGRREFAAEIYRKANIHAPEMVWKAIQERNETSRSRKEEMDALKNQL